MTDGPDSERAERLARLNRRRSAVAGSTADRAAGPVLPPPSVPVTPAVGGPAPAPTRTRRRQSPATTAKIVTVGASTTAVLGIMAGYGIAEQAAADEPVLLPAAQSVTPPLTPVATVPPAAPTPTILPAVTTPPQVIVVVIDGATGQQVSGDIDLSTLAATPPGAAGTDPTAPAVSTDTPAPAPAPVAAPTAVDLAVPAPPAPAPATANPAPAPEPAATSDGS